VCCVIRHKTRLFRGNSQKVPGALGYDTFANRVKDTFKIVDFVSGHTGHSFRKGGAGGLQNKR
jgi:hypothetical protein